MRIRSIVVFALALIFGGVAVAAAKVWLEGQRQLMFSQSGSSTAEMGTIVVAASGLRFGDLLQDSNLKEIPWPAGTTPTGSFHTRADVVKGGDRYVVTAIEANEPVLAWKITGPGQRATLSATLDPGMKAVTIRVNDVVGVAGFVLPGDRVDVLLTRTGSNDAAAPVTYVDVLLQGVKVLAIDQSADDRTDKPAVVKAVTFEVNTEQAQKLTLAASVGQLSLALRNVAAAGGEKTRRVTVTDLELNPPPAPSPLTRLFKAAEVSPAAPVDEIINVYRNLQRAEYHVKPGS
jgi:pilus assembly protein CpaB